MKATILGIAFAAATLGMAGSATAAPITVLLPQAEYRIQGLDVNRGSISISKNYGSDGTRYPLYRPGTYSTSGSTRAGETDYVTEASLTLSNDNWGTVSAKAKTQQFAGGTSGGIFYYFTVIGPEADYVPVTIAGFGSADAKSLSGYATSYAEMRINYIDGSSNARSSVLEAFNPGEHRDFSDVINIKPNSNARTGAPSISLFAAAGVGSNDYSNLGYYSGSASAFIDPLISIADPALARLYTIQIGLSDVILVPPVLSTVPLPKSLPLFALGLIVMGIAGLSRRRSAETA